MAFKYTRSPKTHTPSRIASKQPAITRDGYADGILIIIVVHLRHDRSICAIVLLQNASRAIAISDLCQGNGSERQTHCEEPHLESDVGQRYVEDPMEG